MSEPILRAEALVKKFPGVVALKGVDFDLRAGEVHAVCGENGAGKSTLIKVLAGLHPVGSYDGRVFVDGRVAGFASIRDARRAGIAVIHQELALVGSMTAAENVFLGDEPMRGPLIDWDRVYGEAARLLERFEIDIPVTARVDDLGVGQQQLVEIAKALSHESRILILDEPTAALSDQEVGRLFDIIRTLRERNVTCLYISHKLDEVFSVADRITVLRDGESVATRDAAATSRDRVIHDMVGRRISEMFPRRAGPVGDTLLAVRGLCVADRRGGRVRLADVDFEVRAGEVLGIGGLMGAGRSELLLHLFGVFGHRVAGEVLLDGRALARSPRRAIERGLVLVSEDRKRYGLIMDQSVGFNLSLSVLRDLSRCGFVDAEEETRRCRRQFDALGVRAPGLAAPVTSLSGGNQQKVVLGKALMTDPRVVLLDEPTRGIDVGAKLEVCELINALTDRGLAVVLVSSELPELMGMSDRIVMLNRGRIGGRFTRAEATAQKLMAAAIQSSRVGDHKKGASS